MENVAEKQIELDGHTYILRKAKLTPTKQVFTRLANLCGPSFSAMLTSDPEGPNMSMAMSLLLSNLKVDDLTYVENVLFGCTFFLNAQGTEVPLKTIAEDHFSDDFDRYLKVLAQSMHLHFARFLGGLGIDLQL